LSHFKELLYHGYIFFISTGFDSSHPFIKQTDLVMTSVTTRSACFFGQSTLVWHQKTSVSGVRYVT
jgi:hypothetical protein